MRVARWGQTHCCLKFWLHTGEPSALSRPNMRRSSGRFNHRIRNTRVALPQEETSATLPGFLFFGYDFSRHGMIDSHRQDIDRFPIMLLRQRHCQMPTLREGSMPVHVCHSYPHKSIHAMYYNLACIVVVSIISVVI